MTSHKDILELAKKLHEQTESIRDGIKRFELFLLDNQVRVRAEIFIGEEQKLILLFGKIRQEWGIFINFGKDVDGHESITRCHGISRIHLILVASNLPQLYAEIVKVQKELLIEIDQAVAVLDTVIADFKDFAPYIPCDCNNAPDCNTCGGKGQYRIKDHRDIREERINKFVEQATHRKDPL